MSPTSPSIKEVANSTDAPLSKNKCCLDNEATNTTPIFNNGTLELWYTIINRAFNDKHPLHQRRRQFINFKQSTSQNELEARERLLFGEEGKSSPMRHGWPTGQGNCVCSRE